MAERVAADLAPEPAMARAVELIEEAGYPRHEKVVEAVRVLRDALRQFRIVEDMRRKGVLKGEFEDVEIARRDAPNVCFRGRLLASINSKDETRQADRKKTRWSALEVWELESGAWVAASIACSDVEGEIDFGAVEHIAADVAMEERRRRVMGLFGYTWLAKKMAERLGWDVAETLT